MRLLAAVCLGTGVWGCSSPAVRQRRTLYCTRCDRRVETRETLLFDMRVSRSTGPVRATRYSAVYDDHIEDPDAPHPHFWRLAETAVDSLSGFAFRERSRQQEAQAFLTRFALQIVADCAKTDAKFAREVYETVVSDHQRQDAKMSRRLAELSKAVHEARTAHDAFGYWRVWWQRHKRSYRRRETNRPALTRYRPRPTRILTSPRSLEEMRRPQGR